MNLAKLPNGRETFARLKRKVESEEVDSTFHLAACLLIYYSLRLIFPILNIPGHTAPGAHRISFEFGTEPIAILEEIDVILHSVFLNEFA